MKKKLLIIVLLVTTIILLIAVGVYAKSISNLKLEIEGVDISKDEYIRAMNSKKYDITQYFIKEYGAKITKNFWEEEFNGEYPYKMLADSTIDELVRIHSIYEIAKENGYVYSAKYEDFINRLENENRTRAENIKNGKPIYGLSKYSEDLFLEYETDQLQKNYCNDLSNERMEITNNEGKEYYDKNKDRLFIKNDDFELAYVKVYYGYLELDDEEVKNIKKHMIEISKKIDDNNSLTSLVENDEVLKEYFTNETILSEELSAKAKIIEDIIEISMELYSGDVTQVLDQNGCLYLIQCINRIDYDYIPYEEVVDNVKKALREEHYDDIVAKRAEGLKVIKDDNNVYNFTKNNIK